MAPSRWPASPSRPRSSSAPRRGWNDAGSCRAKWQDAVSRKRADRPRRQMLQLTPAPGGGPGSGHLQARSIDHAGGAGAVSRHAVAAFGVIRTTLRSCRSCAAVVDSRWCSIEPTRRRQGARWQQQPTRVEVPGDAQVVWDWGGREPAVAVAVSVRRRRRSIFPRRTIDLRMRRVPTGSTVTQWHASSTRVSVPLAAPRSTARSIAGSGMAHASPRLAVTDLSSSPLFVTRSHSTSTARQTAAPSLAGAGPPASFASGRSHCRAGPGAGDSRSVEDRVT